MSEYQYYSFRAVDRPLSSSEMKQLRNISSRAEITAESFVNEYNYGDLKANPRDLMRQFFDVHVYLANWGSAVLMLRLPREALDVETVNAFAVDGYFEAEALADYWLLTWSLGESDDYQDFEEAGRSCASAYDLVSRLLVDLRDAYELQGTPDTFHREFQQFMTEHGRRKALVTRLVKAGLR